MTLGSDFTDGSVAHAAQRVEERLGVGADRARRRRREILDDRDLALRVDLAALLLAHDLGVVAVRGVAEGLRCRRGLLAARTGGDGTAASTSTTTSTTERGALMGAIVPGYRGPMRLRRRRDREQRGFRYSAWDGTQRGFDLDADALLDEMTDDLLYHGDLHASLRRLMQQGMQDRNGEQLMGLRDMLQKLREQRKEMLENYDLGGVYEEIAEQLREIVEQEREGIERRVDEALQSGDRRRQEIVDDLAKERREQLDQLPPDLAGKVNELQQYDWMDDAPASASRS